MAADRSVGAGDMADGLDSKAEGDTEVVVAVASDRSVRAGTDSTRSSKAAHNHSGVLSAWEVGETGWDSVGKGSWAAETSLCQYDLVASALEGLPWSAIFPAVVRPRICWKRRHRADS